VTVLETCQRLARHPIRELICQWNWKHAVFTVVVRSGVFFATNLVDGWPSAVRALLVDIAFRVPLSGVYATISQALGPAQPRWAALAIVTGLVPAASHAIEVLVHWLMATPQLRTSVLVSMAFSVLSALFNVFSVRRGAFIVGAAARPFWEDVRGLPGLLVDFLLAPARVAWRLVLNRDAEST
jgi:hypothetical protein